MASKNKWLVGITLCSLALVFVLTRLFRRNSSITELVIFFFFLIILVSASIFFFARYNTEVSIKKTEERNNKLFYLEEKYNYIFYLVDAVIQADTKEFLDSFEKNTHSFCNVTIQKNDYLCSFDDKLSKMQERKYSGEIDVFKVASCLMFAIIEQFDVSIRQSRNKRIFLSRALKIQIALDCALQSITFTKTNHLNQVEKYSVYDVVISDDTLYKNILNALIEDCSDGIEYIVQFANMLNVIYLLACQC